MFKRLFTALTILFVVFFAWFLASTQPVTRQSTPNTTFEIKPNTPLNTIINDLSELKLIRSRTAFKLSVLRLGVASKIQAGFFELNSNMTAAEIARALTRAFSKQVRVTIPEGLRNEEINFILERSFNEVKGNLYTRDEFAKLTRDLTGKLFPDTYDFELTSTSGAVVKKLTTRHNEVFSVLNIEETKRDHVLILASLLEREAADSSEMPQIAGVIEKRLLAGWPLQIDATVQYALGTKTCKTIDCNWWKQSLTLADLGLVSPYNTYTNKGLPPKPISNPGKAALAAAAKPFASTAWFYLHDPEGKIHFADTVEQHNQNVCTYLKKYCK